MSERPHVPGPEDPTPADVPRGEADVPHGKADVPHGKADVPRGKADVPVVVADDEREDQTDPATGPGGA